MRHTLHTLEATFEVLPAFIRTRVCLVLFPSLSLQLGLDANWALFYEMDEPLPFLLAKELVGCIISKGRPVIGILHVHRN